MKRTRLWMLLPLLLLGGCGLPGANATEHVSQQLTVSGAPTIVLNSDAGEVDVSAGADGVVKVDADKRARSSADLKDMNVSIAGGGGRVTISFRSENRNLSNRSVHFVIAAPKDSRLQLRTGGGSITTDGFTQSVQARSGGGSITAGHARGSVDAETGGGSISIGGSLTGPNRAKTGGGSIDVTLPADSRLTVQATTGGGSISTDFGLRVVGTGNQTATGMLGDGSAGMLDLQTGGGSITLRKEATSSRRAPERALATGSSAS